MKITLIAAADKKWGIGLNGHLPWQNTDDLRHFKARTMGKNLLVGRKTMETLPPLPGRNVHSLSSVSGDFPTIAAALSHFHEIGTDELIIAGGAMVYEGSLKFCNSAEISRINRIYECDTFMPDLRAVDGWRLIDILEKTPNLSIEYWENECTTLK